jgi:hypothetical protein
LAIASTVRWSTMSTPSSSGSSSSNTLVWGDLELEEEVPGGWERVERGKKAETSIEARRRLLRLLALAAMERVVVREAGGDMAAVWLGRGGVRYCRGVVAGAGCAVESGRGEFSYFFVTRKAKEVDLHAQHDHFSFFHSLQLDPF